jgi:hypothetical protein
MVIRTRHGSFQSCARVIYNKPILRSLDWFMNAQTSVGVFLRVLLPARS